MNWRIGITRLIFVLGGLWAVFVLLVEGGNTKTEIALAFGPLFGMIMLAVLGDWIIRGLQKPK